ncbi:MAG: hypothetical protein WC836_24610 [Desulfobacula sp.]|jgi:hypothetical protein
MIILTDGGKSVDTDTLSPEERHIIQKLMAWQSLVDSLAKFRVKKEEALKAGWNNSGPVRESRDLSLVIRSLEKKLLKRLGKNQ